MNLLNKMNMNISPVVLMQAKIVKYMEKSTMTWISISLTYKTSTFHGKTWPAERTIIMRMQSVIGLRSNQQSELPKPFCQDLRAENRATQALTQSQQPVIASRLFLI